MIAEMPFCVPNVNGWLIPNTSRSGNFGTDYYLRLETAEIGLLANDAREARDAMRGWNPEAEAWYADDVSTILTELNKRKG